MPPTTQWQCPLSSDQHFLSPTSRFFNRLTIFAFVYVPSTLFPSYRGKLFFKDSSPLHGLIICAQAVETATAFDSLPLSFTGNRFQMMIKKENWVLFTVFSSQEKSQGHVGVCDGWYCLSNLLSTYRYLDVFSDPWINMRKTFILTRSNATQPRKPMNTLQETLHVRAQWIAILTILQKLSGFVQKVRSVHRSEWHAVSQASEWATSAGTLFYNLSASSD